MGILFIMLLIPLALKKNPIWHMQKSSWQHLIKVENCYEKKKNCVLMTCHFLMEKAVLSTPQTLINSGYIRVCANRTYRYQNTKCRFSAPCRICSLVLTFLRAKHCQISIYSNVKYSYWVQVAAGDGFFYILFMFCRFWKLNQFVLAEKYYSSYFSHIDTS